MQRIYVLFDEESPFIHSFKPILMYKIVKYLCNKCKENERIVMDGWISYCFSLMKRFQFSAIK